MGSERSRASCWFMRRNFWRSVWRGRARNGGGVGSDVVAVRWRAFESGIEVDFEVDFEFESDAGAGASEGEEVDMSGRLLVAICVRVS